MAHVKNQSATKNLLLFLLVFYLTWTVRATVFYTAVDQSIPDETTRLIFANIVKFLLWVVPAVAYVLWLKKENPSSSMKINTSVDKRGLVVGSIVSLTYFAATFTLEKFISGRTLAPLLQASAVSQVITLAQVFFSPIAEEIMFRGFVLPQLNGCMEFWKANVLQAALFTAIHWPNWIWVNGLQPGILASSIGVMAIGLLLGWLFKRTNSIWPPVIVHIANNFLVSFLG